MSENVLVPNESKSEVIMITPALPTTSDIGLSPSLNILSNHIHKEARNLGVISDSELSFDTQVTKVLQSCSAHLRQLYKVRSFPSPGYLEKVIRAFISSRPDFCSALYSGISKCILHGHQLFQNAAARFLMGTKRSEHITPVPAATCEF